VENGQKLDLAQHFLYHSSPSCYHFTNSEIANDSGNTLEPPPCAALQKYNSRYALWCFSPIFSRLFDQSHVAGVLNT
jgi:hypothetical protein